MLIKFIIVLILNIPVSIMFHKAWLNGKNAFIPFLNVFEYFELVGFKRKYLISVLMIIFTFLLCWNNHKGLGLYAQGMYYGLGDWIVLLYSTSHLEFSRPFDILKSNFTFIEIFSIIDLP